MLAPTACSIGVSFEGSAFQAARFRGKSLAKSVTELPKVPRAPTVVVSEAEEPTCVADDCHELAMVGSGRRTETNFDGVTQPEPNQGLLIVVPMSVEDYIKEGWFDSRLFATIPESEVLLSVTNVGGRSVLTRLFACQERWKHVGKCPCVEGDVVP